MALITKGKSVVVEDETYKLTKRDIEFLLNIIENSMVPGKYISLANVVIQKLQNQSMMADRNQVEIKSALTNWKDKQTKPKGKPTIQKKGDEVWIEEK
tara:strand:+ start:103 stop:396 length:294 start_codon:yes stop_codon:yes gene_type:complete